VLYYFPPLPIRIVGGINLWNFNPEKVVPEAYIPYMYLGEEGTLGLR
jgi:hypothetical protein